MTTDRIRIIVEVYAGELFGDNNVNWQYAKDHAHYTTEECRFILDVGRFSYDRHSLYQLTLLDMKVYGCTEEFLNKYTELAKMGADYVLFYV